MPWRISSAMSERHEFALLASQDTANIRELCRRFGISSRTAYKWLHRFDRDGLEGLKDKERSGRPSSVSKEIMVKIRKELEDSNTGWDFRQVMDLIYKRARVRYHEVHIYRLLHKWGFKPNLKYHKKGL